MPELPEVERARRLIEGVAAGHRIKRVTCARDTIVFDRVSPNRVRHVLAERTVVAVHRHGKHLWLELDQRPWPCFHLGMTGEVFARGGTPPQLNSTPPVQTKAWPPRFTKIHLVIDTGAELAMTNKRRLGRIRLRDDPARELPISRLGFDPLLDLPSPQRFVDALHSRSTTIKALLLDQTFAAGVGNWIADEVLYQARIDPRRRANALSLAEAKRLRTKLKRIIETAVLVDADKSLFPRDWLFHRRWGRKRGTTIRGKPIEFLTIGGRTTAWVPAVQRQRASVTSAETDS
ncbi:uncharacterized protein METZ01_LOCUS75320 [marine metagenome]|uniref:Formamidopyrimidine-DNA glycosylase catalytic domain-containing protein n=1 Tax=marine metagenome TaxID=408172 RepID=A0A381U2K7_9ZZZZ